MIFDRPRYLYSGDQYLTVEIGDEMTLKANFMVIGLDRAVKQAGIGGLIETFPGWRSLMIHYDSIRIRTSTGGNCSGSPGCLPICPARRRITTGCGSGTGSGSTRSTITCLSMFVREHGKQPTA